MSERQLFTFEIDYNGCLHLNEIYSSSTLCYAWGCCGDCDACTVVCVACVCAVRV